MKRRRQITATLLLAVVACLGCAGADDLADRYAEFERVGSKEQLTEVPLGRFTVPMPPESVSPQSTYSSLATGAANLQRIHFTLHALVEPDSLSQTEQAIERQAGELRDRIIAVARHASTEDLSDPQLTTLKLRIMDKIEPLLLGVEVRRLVITEYRPEPY